MLMPPLIWITMICHSAKSTYNDFTRTDDSGASRHDESLNAKPVEFLRTDSPSTLKREELISSNSNSGSLDEGRRSNVEEVLGSRRKPLGNDDSLGVMVTETVRLQGCVWAQPWCGATLTMFLNVAVHTATSYDFQAREPDVGGVVVSFIN